MATPEELPIESNNYDVMSNKLRDFFRSRDFREAYAQNRLDTLSACENPFNVATFEYLGQTWPLRQTNQMALEVDLMKKEKLDCAGLYCFTTSYRNELPEEMVPGRHATIFPMIEFEIAGSDMNQLISFERDLIKSLGYTGEFAEIDFEDACKMFDVDDLTHVHEDTLCRTLAPVVFLKNFPDRSQPFWNMRRDPSTPDYAKKVDVLMLGVHGGMETIGSAQREESVETMKHNFNTVSEGAYAKMMYEKFGKERVDTELEGYFSLNMMPRSGGGIGGTRLLHFMRLHDLLGHSSSEKAVIEA